jgi:hypothetical protein
MRDISLPEFDTSNDFFDLRDIVKSHAEQDSSWAEEIEKVVDMVPGKVKHFMEHPICNVPNFPLKRYLVLLYESDLIKALK